jgi:hypothetical protein
LAKGMSAAKSTIFLSRKIEYFLHFTFAEIEKGEIIFS